MAAEPVPDEPVDVRTVPGYAWDWVQRSRPIVNQLAEVLTGQPPRHGFVDAVRRSYAQDPLVRDAVLSVIATAAFRGRVPSARPPGVSWDRGLVWWAATLAGCTPQEFTQPGVEIDQPALFTAPAGTGTSERAALIAALHDLLAHTTGDQVPASAIRQLIAHLQHGARGGSESR